MGITPASLGSLASAASTAFVPAAGADGRFRRHTDHSHAAG